MYILFKKCGRPNCGTGYSKKTGIQISEIALGAEHIETAPYETVRRILDMAMDAGVNYTDLFMGSPDNRDNIGRALRGSRDKMMIAGEYSAVMMHYGDEIIGYCLYRTEDGHNGRYDIYVRQYYILPEYRRRGLGRQGFLTLTEEAFAGAVGITLDVLECNARGRAFWESVGFVPYVRHMRLKRE